MPEYIVFQLPASVVGGPQLISGFVVEADDERTAVDSVISSGLYRVTGEVRACDLTATQLFHVDPNPTITEVVND